MELINQLADELRRRLKTSDGVPSDFVALRTVIQVMRPDVDQLSDAALPIAERHFKEFRGTFLDVGCYGGWMYPHIRHLVDYRGIDFWPAGIEAAKKMFGEHLFELVDMFQYEKKHDVVWCSQILGNSEEVWARCKSLATNLCIYVSPDASDRLSGLTEFYKYRRMGVAIWRSDCRP